MFRINNEILLDFIHCQYKAYRKSKQQNGIVSDYEILYDQLKLSQKANFEKSISENSKPILHQVIFDGTIPKEGIALDFNFKNENIDLTIDGIEFTGKKKFIPIFITPFEKVTRTDKVFIALQTNLIQSEFNLIVENCKVIFGKSLQEMQFKLSSFTKTIKKIIGEVNNILVDSVEPSLILNRHCSVCEYSASCNEKAKTVGNMSLLDRATLKAIEKYKKKGIFTIQQLSYLYKPRRKKKRANQLVAHNLELQALALRSDKIYAQQLPELSRQPIELFLDIEGNPDQELYYLIGILTCKDNAPICYSFWADKASDEAHIWQQFLSILYEYPSAPIYHYGNYELKAIDLLGKRYHTNVTHIQDRLINIVNSIYGKIYFPTYSNRLKELGNYVGATWSSVNASGIQSLIWRHQWEDTQDKKYKQLLTTYNIEDCQALKLLTDKLSLIQQSADILPEIDFVANPKRNSTGTSSQVHQQFGNILKFAHENYDGNKISFENIGQQEIIEKKKVGGIIGHKTRTIPKAGKVTVVPRKRICPKDKVELKKSSRGMARSTITELIFTKNTIRKTVIKYIGNKGYCCKCKQDYSPPIINRTKHQHFGHNFKAWVVYQRLFLRLPYDIIRLNLKELFNEKVSQSTVADIIINFSQYYRTANNTHLKLILQSPFIHVDETQVNIKGLNHYVWIFTNGKHVFFQLTETREISVTKNLLSDFKGILISDFYSGYDSLKCRHQKCLVHLIRNMNDDLWKFPFDAEYEKFIREFRDIIIPIFETIRKYESKKYHFNKFQKNINEFYNRIIKNETYTSEITLKYQTRLKKYWTSLFTFMEFDNIPWNNNMAERGLRHLAVQRKISTHFNNATNVYLLFLGIMQTCRFQKISFLKFLLSAKKSI